MAVVGVTDKVQVKDSGGTVIDPAKEGTLSDIKTAVQLVDDAVATTGSAIPVKGILVSGSDGTNARPLKVDASGEPQVDVLTLPSSTLAGSVAAKTVDYDSGAGTDNVPGVGILLPKSGGAVAGGTSTDPIRTDPTGTTTQPVSGPLTDVQLRATPVPVSGTVTETNSGAIKTAVELIDDTVMTDGAGTPSKGIVVMGTDGTNPQIIKTDANGEAQVDVLSSALPSGASTSAKQDTVISNTSPAVAYTEAVVDLNTAHAAGAELALIGSSKQIRWAKIVYHDGVASVLTSGAIDATGNFLYIGSTSNNKVYLPALLAPDSDVIWEGRITGDIYLKNTSQSGKHLVVRIGYE